ncbi:hypothetical protein HDV63DRAFT_398968 [Trichoderma sp. SZMC 28014]
MYISHPIPVKPSVKIKRKIPCSDAKRARKLQSRYHAKDWSFGSINKALINLPPGIYHDSSGIAENHNILKSQSKSFVLMPKTDVQIRLSGSASNAS